MSDYLSLFHSVYNKEQANLDEALNALKLAGATQMESVVIVKKLLGVSLSEADNMVIKSIVWKENKDANDKFRRGFESYLEDLD